VSNNCDRTISILHTTTTNMFLECYVMQMIDGDRNLKKTITYTWNLLMVSDDEDYENFDSHGEDHV